MSAVSFPAEEIDCDRYCVGCRFASRRTIPVRNSQRKELLAEYCLKERSRRFFAGKIGY